MVTPAVESLRGWRLEELAGVIGLLDRELI